MEKTLHNSHVIFTLTNDRLDVEIPPLLSIQKDRVDLEVSIELKDSFTKKTAQLVHELQGIAVLKKERQLQGKVTQRIIAGEDFGLEVSVWHNEHLDELYEGSKEITFSCASRNIHEKLILEFNKGKATTPPVFLCEKQGQACITVEDPLINSSGKISFDIYPSKLHQFCYSDS